MSKETAMSKSSRKKARTSGQADNRIGWIMVILAEAMNRLHQSILPHTPEAGYCFGPKALRLRCFLASGEPANQEK